MREQGLVQREAIWGPGWGVADGLRPGWQVTLVSTGMGPDGGNGGVVLPLCPAW